MTCIYCGGRRKDPEMSREHIWPQALGGQSSPPLFQSEQVCKTCNSLCGLWVDGAFLKSWYISHERGNAARSYLDPQKPGVTPLMFMGLDRRFPVQEGEVAELWMGPGGDSVHHIHKADDDKWYGIAGGDIIRRSKIDAGRAYIMLRSESPYWLAVSMKSFVAFMSPARLFTATLMPNVTGPVIDKLTSESQATPVEASELAWIRQSDNLHMVSFSHRLDFSRRFLAKLALGIGANLFGPAYLETAYVGELRRALWANIEDDEAGALRGSDLFNESSLDGAYLNGIHGAWSMHFQAMPKAFGMMIATPGGRTMAIQIADQPALWSDAAFTPYHNGTFYFVVPERAYFSHPVGLLDFVQHKNGHGTNTIMAEIEGFQSDPKSLPPLR